MTVSRLRKLLRLPMNTRHHADMKKDVLVVVWMRFGQCFEIKRKRKARKKEFWRVKHRGNSMLERSWALFWRFLRCLAGFGSCFWRSWDARWAKLGPSWWQVSPEMGHDGAKIANDSAKIGNDGAKMGILRSSWELCSVPESFFERFGPWAGKRETCQTIGVYICCCAQMISQHFYCIYIYIYIYM